MRTIKLKVPMLDENNNLCLVVENAKISFWDWLRLLLALPVPWKKGKLSPLWKGELPLFIVHCSKHGFTITYPQGWDGIKTCLLCLRKLS